MTRHVLVIEDVRSQLHVYTRVLRRAGHRVHGCETAQAGYLSLTQSGPYDLVLVDMNLPDLKAAKLLPLVQGVLREETPPFVLITGSSGTCVGRDGLARPNDWETYVENGFADALAKPLNPRRLAGVVETVLSGSGTHVDLSSSTQWIEAAEAWAQLED